jgi:hypothetical protein
MISIGCEWRRLVGSRVPSGARPIYIPRGNWADLLLGSGHSTNFINRLLRAGRDFINAKGGKLPLSESYCCRKS